MLAGFYKIFSSFAKIFDFSYMFERKREPLYKIDLKDVYKGPGEDAKKLMGDRIKINSDFKRF